MAFDSHDIKIIIVSALMGILFYSFSVYILKHRHSFFHKNEKNLYACLYAVGFTPIILMALIHGINKNLENMVYAIFIAFVMCNYLYQKVLLWKKKINKKLEGDKDLYHVPDKNRKNKKK